MALVLADRVRDTTTTTGTGTVTLSGTAPTGYQTFGTAIGNGNTTYYTINGGSEWEVGIGTYSSTGPTLSRDTVLASSAGGTTKVTFSAGTKNVFVTYPAEESVYQDGSAIKAGTAILGVANGGTGAATLTGYVKGTGTAALTASATIPASDISSGAALTKADDTNVTLTLGGSPTTAQHAATSITAGWTGQLAVSRGGTGASSLTSNGVLYGSGTSAIAATAAGTTGQILIGNTGAAPSWSALTSNAVTSISFGSTGLTPSTATQGAVTVAGTLAVGNGGTGTATAFTAGSVVFAGASGVYSQKNANFFWDNTNNRLGIGTTSPGFTVEATGDIRLGGGGDLRLGSATGTTGSSGDSSIFSDANDMNFSVGSNIRMYIANGGNVGIGTTGPGYRLDIASADTTAGLGYAMRIRANATAAGGAIQFTDSGVTAQWGFLAATSTAVTFDCSTVGSLVFRTNGSERMRVDSNGKLLLGTSSAIDGAAFQINAATAGDAVYVTRFDNTSTSTSAYNVSRWLQGASGSSVGYIGTGGSAVGATFFRNRFVVGTQNNTALCFATNDTFRGMIDGGGQFWWGSQSTIDTVSYAPFQVTNAIAIDTLTTGGTTAMSFFNGQGSGVRVGYIGTSGSSTSYNTSSDQRLKKNIADAVDAGSVIDAIQVRQFDWKINDEHQRYGMIAQELDEVFPEAVAHGPTETDMLAVDYSKLVPMLVKEIQSLRARVAQLEGK